MNELQLKIHIILKIHMYLKNENALMELFRKGKKKVDILTKHVR